MAASAWAIALPTDAAQAAAQRFRFDIPAGSATSVLAAYSEATGVAIGWSGGLPAMRLPPLRGTMTADAALRRLLAGSGYRAVKVGATAYRLEPAPAPPQRRPVAPAIATPAPVIATPGPVGDIIVTGQKRPQSLREAPMSISVADLDSTQLGQVAPGTRDIAASVEGLAMTNLGPGRNRQFIRGVADSPFNGPSQSTVAVQLDEARVTFDAPDPDIRVVDMERVEVLKGPQGPLYGSGALGGIYHLVTRKPDLTDLSAAARIGGQVVTHGGVGGGIDGVINLPIATDRLAIRGVGYFTEEAGWIDNVGRNKNANSTNVAGGRLALRWQPAHDWTVDLAGTLQDVTVRDSQYVTGSDDTIRRVSNIAEPVDNDFKMAIATVRGKLGAADVLATSSYVRHEISAILDSTPASAAFGLTGPSSFTDDRRFRIINHELRVSSTGRIAWLAGLSYMNAYSRSDGTIAGANRELTIQSLDRQIEEIAIFGEATVPIAKSFKATIGARLYNYASGDEAIEQAGAAVFSSNETIFSPSVALSWAPSQRLFTYLRYARALRPGGIGLTDETPVRAERFDSDELGTFDLGARYNDPARGIAATISLFQTSWQSIQSDHLLPNGLISTGNAGSARIYGVEAEASWRPVEPVSLLVGASYVDAHLVRDAAGAQLDDRHLPVTPSLTARGRARYLFALGSWSGTADAEINYVGRSHLSFDPDLDRRMGNYATSALAMSMRRGTLSIDLRLDNMLDVRGDSFAFGNAFSVASGDQFTPIRPRTFSIAFGKRW